MVLSAADSLVFAVGVFAAGHFAARFSLPARHEELLCTTSSKGVGGRRGAGLAGSCERLERGAGQIGWRAMDLGCTHRGGVRRLKSLARWLHVSSLTGQEVFIQDVVRRGRAGREAGEQARRRLEGMKACDWAAGAVRRGDGLLRETRFAASDKTVTDGASDNRCRLVQYFVPRNVSSICHYSRARGFDARFEVGLGNLLTLAMQNGYDLTDEFDNTTFFNKTAQFQ